MRSSLSFSGLCSVSGEGRRPQDCRHQDQLHEILAKIFGFFYCFGNDFVNVDTKCQRNGTFYYFFLSLLSKVKINDTKLVRKRLCVTAERDKISTVNSVWKFFIFSQDTNPNKPMTIEFRCVTSALLFLFCFYQTCQFDSHRLTDSTLTHESITVQPNRSRPRRDETRRNDEASGRENRDHKCQTRQEKWSVTKGVTHRDVNIYQNY